MCVCINEHYVTQGALLLLWEIKKSWLNMGHPDFCRPLQVIQIRATLDTVIYQDTPSDILMPVSLENAI